MTWRVNLRARDAQKQLAQTSLKPKMSLTSFYSCLSVIIEKVLSILFKVYRCVKKRNPTQKTRSLEYLFLFMLVNATNKLLFYSYVVA